MTLTTFQMNMKYVTSEYEGCAQHTCFYPPQFRQGSLWRRQRQASHSFKITHLIVFELHFYIPTNKTTNKVDQADQLGGPPQQHRQSLRKREGTAAAAFLVLLRVEISHENFITGSSKARQGAAPPSLETFANFWVSQKNSDFWNFRFTNPYVEIMDQ